ncbi:MAG: lipoprotein insertase outer membrane protein LolB [Desulfatibacillaceae bacterium]|nr:lipoprotein insertase outer membrane protein LolB [Desulfatibacillaceae bacterium]
MQQQLLKSAPKAGKWIAVLILLFFCTSCAGVGPSTPSDGKARALLETLLQENAKQHAFNGAGRFGIKEQNSGMSGRILWMGIAPDKLRVEMLNPFGQPIVSASSDGTRVYAFDRAQGRFHTRPKGRGDLESILGISISVSDMVLLFSGRVPIAGSRARMAAGPGQPNRLEIVDFFGNIRQSILFDDDFSRVLETTVYSSASTPAWTAVLDYAGDRAMPSVKVHDTTGREFYLEVEKFDAAAQVDLAGFVLQPPAR